MVANRHDGLTALAALRGKLDETSHLEVIHPAGHVWKAYFTFKPSAAVEEIEVVKQELQVSLPPAYERFLGYSNAWPTTYLIFAESFGDSDLLVLDASQSIDEGDDCHVIDGDSGYLPHEWRLAARSFAKWLDRLVVAQGAKYWRWY